MKEIELSQSKVALVSDEDYEYLMQWKWTAVGHHKKTRWYAMRSDYIGKIEGKYKYKTIYMHKVIAELLNLDTSLHIDHINNNPLDNRRSNLRAVTVKQNMENMGLPKNNTSGHRGVCWHKSKKKWCAKLRHNGITINLGEYKNKEDAIKARIEGEQKYWTHSQACN